MTKKKYIILLLMVLMMPLITTKVYAEEKQPISIEKYICGEKNKSELENKVSKIKLTYELITEVSKEEEEDGLGGYFRVKVTNFSENIYIKIDGYEYHFKDVGESFNLSNRFPYGGGKVKLDFYGEDGHPCKSHYISSKTITLPKYNVFSELEECLEYEEFALCNRYYKGSIESKEDFLKKLEEYKNNIKNNKSEKQKFDIIDRIFSFIEDNQLLCASIAFIIAGIIIFFVVKKIIRAKNRTKIKM